MKKRVFIVFIVALALTIGSVLVSWANVPPDGPPPVNQRIGIADTTFNNMAEADCRACHNTNPPIPVVDPEYLPTRHHNLINQPITCPTDSPFVTCPVPPGTTYLCVSCHKTVWDDVEDANVLEIFRDCTFCHKQSAVTGATVHHATDLAQAKDCKSCHGSLIDNPNEPFTDTNNNGKWDTGEPFTDTNGNLKWDGHYIPTYQPSMVTPRTDLGQTSGPLGSGQGGCGYCHDNDTNRATDTPAGTDLASGIKVYTNAQTHHSTGLSAPPYTYPSSGNCLWCHDTNPGGSNDIRACEQCHGVGSLHNIQTDSNGNGIVPGQELPYYGHIGANADCNGCHLNTSASAAAPYSGPVVPDVIGMSEYTLTQGTAATITVYGSAFTNIAEGPTGPILKTSNVVLTAANGTTTTLTPTTITESSLDVTIPATLAAGNYDLRAVKSTKASNPTVITVKTAVVINSATCSSGVVTITGSGFSEYVNAVNSGTSVKLGANACSVNSWSDTQINANCGTCSGTVAVSSVFGTASKTVVDVTPPTCTSFTYTAWSACVNGLQSRTVLTSSPAGCVGGNRVLTQTCNLPPFANAGPDKTAKRYTYVRFDGSASKDPDGTITKYSWNFGDGTSGSGKIVTKRYSRTGTFTVTLTVTDNKNATGKDTAIAKITY